MDTPWTYRTRLLLREGLLLFTCSFFLHIPPGDRRKKSKKKKKNPVSRQESIDSAEGEKVRRRRDGWGCEWEGELVKREGSPSLRPASLVLLPSQQYFPKPSPIVFFSIFTSTTGVQTFLYPVILPFTQLPACCAFSVASYIMPYLQAGNPFPRDPDISCDWDMEKSSMTPLNSWIPAFFVA